MELTVMIVMVTTLVQIVLHHVSVNMANVKVVSRARETVFLSHVQLVGRALIATPVGLPLSVRIVRNLVLANTEHATVVSLVMEHAREHVPLDSLGQTVINAFLVALVPTVSHVAVLMAHVTTVSRETVHASLAISALSLDQIVTELALVSMANAMLASTVMEHAPENAIHLSLAQTVIVAQATHTVQNVLRNVPVLPLEQPNVTMDLRVTELVFARQTGPVPPAHSVLQTSLDLNVTLEIVPACTEHATLEKLVMANVSQELAQKAGPVLSAMNVSQVDSEILALNVPVCMVNATGA